MKMTKAEIILELHNAHEVLDGALEDLRLTEAGFPPALNDVLGIIGRCKDALQEAEDATLEKMAEKPHGHIDAQGRFQSDKYPDLPPDKIVLSFTDPKATIALRYLADHYRWEDRQLSKDINARLDALKEAPDDGNAET